MTKEPTRLESWLASALSAGRHVVYKRLSGNDTGATGAHQVGPYIPNRIAFAIAPELSQQIANPRVTLNLALVSHDEQSAPVLIHYNNRLTAGGTRDESRLTGFGGKRSALQNPDSTGAVLIVSFDAASKAAEGWLATDRDEEEIIEAHLGAIEPGVVGYLGGGESAALAAMQVGSGPPICSVEMPELPEAWQSVFPTARELAAEAIRRVPGRGLGVDSRLLRRHRCEYALFRTVEEHQLMPTIQAGFEQMTHFLDLAQRTLQRRKSRAGLSLEHQLAQIFNEEGVLFQGQAETERGHVPDFVFPSADRYQRARPGSQDLGILAAKSTLRDRWRQVLQEADKVPLKHLFTLDEGVSKAQYRDIASSGIQLVVPAGRLTSFPKEIRSDLLTLASFIRMRLRRQASRSAHGGQAEAPGVD